MHSVMLKKLRNMLTTYNLIFVITLNYISCSDITKNVFGSLTDGMPAAFGDFNSDELTDVFVLRNKSTIEIFLAAEEEPLLRSSPLKCSFEREHITSVVPGDFDGDALMDVLISTIAKKHEEGPKVTSIFILWGSANSLNCSDENKPLIEMLGQPVAIDYNQDMIIDLFGMDSDGRRMFWVFSKTRGVFRKIPMEGRDHTKIRLPHSNAFLDLNEDNTADLFITTEKNFEIWYGSVSEKKFIYNNTINYPEKYAIMGQSLFIDVELRGRMDLVTPVCFDEDCNNSTLLVYCDGQWHNLQVNFKDNDNNIWKFYLKGGVRYADTITLHSGDFNMDGYPDLLATLVFNDKPRSFLMENVPCEGGCGQFTRSYVIRWNALSPFLNGTVMAAFFDFYQDGILDIILVQYNKSEYKAAAFKNSLDYDANFIKVMVLTGLRNENNAMIMGRVGKKRRTYGTNLPGPRISYRTTTQEGNLRHAASVQLPQSAHFSLNLPYNIFGLGRTPNFVDSLTVGLSNRSKTWTQIIPNSQMVVIPPTNNSSQWKAQLFVTPSKLILMSVAGLTTVCGMITVIIGVLYWKERQEDKKERLSESHRFHFDAM